MRASSVRLRAAASLALLLGACGTPASAPTAQEDPVRWWPGDTPRPTRPLEGRKELSVLDVPQAAAGGFDVEPQPPSGARRIIVNLETSGTLYVKGMAYPFEDPRAREMLQRVMQDFGRGPGELLVLLRADRLRPWGDVLRLIEWATTVPRIEVAAVHFAVDVGSSIDGRIEARTWWGPTREGSEAPAVSLETYVGPSGAAPRLRIGERTWSFAAGDPYARGPALDAANAAWLEARDALEAIARPTGRLPVKIDPRVPWAHVAQLLALAMLTGSHSVEVSGGERAPRMGLSAPTRDPRRLGIRAGPPPMTPPLEPGERDPRDVHPALLISIGVGFAALVVLLPLSLRRRRRERPRAP